MKLNCIISQFQLPTKMLMLSLTSKSQTLLMVLLGGLNDYWRSIVVSLNVVSHFARGANDRDIGSSLLKIEQYLWKNKEKINIRNTSFTVIEVVSYLT